MTLADDRADQQQDDDEQVPEQLSKAVVKPSRGRVVASLEPSRRPDVDLSESTRPEWLSSWQSIRATAVLWGRRTWHRAKRLGWNTPKVLLLLVVYSPRGLARLISRLAAYLYDYDSAAVRHHHAGKTETPEYVKAHNVRKANLRARWMVFSAAFTLVSAPILAYVAPVALAVMTGLVIAVFIVKLIPGRSMGELFVGVFVGAGCGVACWWGTTLLPDLPGWPFIAVLAALDLVLGWIGRPDRPLATVDASAYDGELTKPTRRSKS